MENADGFVVVPDAQAERTATGAGKGGWELFRSAQHALNNQAAAFGEWVHVTAQPSMVPDLATGTDTTGKGMEGGSASLTVRRRASEDGQRPLARGDPECSERTAALAYAAIVAGLSVWSLACG